jgi:hypothetical protein
MMVDECDHLSIVEDVFLFCISLRSPFSLVVVRELIELLLVQRIIFVEFVIVAVDDLSPLVVI